MAQVPIDQPGTHIPLIKDDPMISQGLMRAIEGAGMSGN
jgi:hypothetical protein